MTATPRPPPPADPPDGDPSSPGPSVPDLDLARWLTLRDLRAGLARRAIRRPKAADSLLESWTWARRPGVVTAVVEGLRVADSSQTRALALWAFGDPPDPPPAPLPEAEWDRLALEAARRAAADPAAEPVPGPALDAAGLYLLARLGEEVALRERRAWSAASFPADPRDEATGRLWAAMFDRGFDPGVADRVRKAFGPEVRRSFRGVALSLGLPPSVADLRAEQALEALETLSWGAHVDLAARLVETRGEPVAALAGALGPAGWEQVAACVRGRSAWTEAWRLLLGDGDPDPARLSPDLLAEGVELVVALRVSASLCEGRAVEHELGLPGWAVVRANRSRIRGRLRVVARAEPERLRDAVLALPGLRARTAAALARYAWDWAWREARVGFGFDPDRMRPPACELPEPAAPPLPPLPDTAAPAVTTLLLNLLGRGCWPDLEAWLTGGGRGLSARFYRYLAEAPDHLADPGTLALRSRGYTRLREHLADGGLDDHTEALRAVCARVSLVPPGRQRKALLHAALLPDWDHSAIPLPRKHVDAFVERLADFAAGAPSPPASGARDEEADA
ncbi:hypothetical protein L6R53_03940 [Myxococcota bacterium]|nr:hypothetical protein [Myxococcota bacterium]